MVYYELSCQLCGLPFAVSRIRTSGEPPEAAWGSDDKYFGTTFVDLNEPKAHREVCMANGCGAVFRGPWKNALYRGPPPILYYDDESSDGDYEVQSDTSYVALECDSAASNEDDGPEKDDGGEAMEDSANLPGSRADVDASSTFSVKGPKCSKTIEPLSSLVISWDEDPSAQDPMVEQYEHIAGPQSQNLAGYHGDKITVEEMRGCNTVQFLVKKQQSWVPSDSDLEFEGHSGWYLTGISEGSYKEECRFLPVRHGTLLASIYGQDPILSIPGRNDYPTFGLAFHPTCFDIFKTISRRKLGLVDADGLVNLREQACEPETCQHRICQLLRPPMKPGWEHRLGFEYWSANPVFIPGFRDICKAAIVSDDDDDDNDDEKFSLADSAFPPHQRPNELSVFGDVFLKLPREIVQEISMLLTPRDLSAVRLISSAFTQLPIFLWHRRVLEDFPFVYEAWCDDVKPNFWTYLDPAQLRETEKERYDYMSVYIDRRDIMREYEPDLVADWEANEPKVPPWHTTEEYDTTVRQRRRLENEKMEPIRLPYEKTNWFQLYRDIAVNWKDLKGLRNRARIWEDISLMVDKIKETREAED